MTHTHPYRPLDASRNEIRLVSIAPSRSGRARVSCQLRHCSLDEDITFEALSYTWGDPGSKRPILLNGVEEDFLVACNLEVALWHLRYVHDERLMWIDALCINQGDLDERNRHVFKMQDIYRKASKVVVWLGKASENSDLAFNFLTEASMRRHGIGDWLPRVFLDASFEQKFRALYDLADRGYWRRVWIIQEIFFGSSIIVRCGFRCMRWSDFVFFFTTVMSRPSLVTQLITKAIENPVKYLNLMQMIPGIMGRCHLPASIEQWKQMSKTEKGGLSLEVLLMSYRNSLSTDPRDKVYGIMGMAQKYEDQRAIKVDYALSKREVYIETIRYLIERGKRFETSPLDIICASLPHFSDGSLPSWVPDWTPPPNTNMYTDLGSMSYFYSANGNPRPEFTYGIDGGVLAVQGFVVSTCQQFGAVPVPFAEAPSAFGVVDQKFALGGTSAKEAFRVAAELALSESGDTPHSKKQMTLRKEEFVRTLLCNRAEPYFDGVPPTDAIRQFCDEVMSVDGEIDWEGNLLRGAETSNGHILTLMTKNLFRHRFCISSTGSLLMAPSQVLAGDLVCVLLGCGMPVVLRKEDENKYIFLGDCYVHGIMDGEAMGDLKAGKHESKEFRIY